MNIIVAPLIVGQQGPEVKNLQENFFWLIRNSPIVVVNDTNIDGMSDEMMKSFFGSHTLAVANTVKDALGISDNQPRGISVNDAYIINEYIKERLNVSGVLTGEVMNLNGKPVAAQILIYSIVFRERSLLGQTTSDVNGHFKFNYVKSYYGIQIDVIVPELVDPVQSDIFKNDTEDIHVTITVPIEGSGNIRSEYELLYQSISSVVGEGIGGLTLDEDLKYVVSMTGENEELVKAYILASNFSNSMSGIPDYDIFYGIIRSTRIFSLELIINLSSAELLNALKYAVDLNIIYNYDVEGLNSVIATLKIMAKQLVVWSAGKDPADSRAIRVLQSALPETMIPPFLDYYYKNDSSDPGFWNNEDIAEAVPGIDTATINKLKITLGYSLISGSNPAIVKDLLNSTVETNVLLNINDWRDMVTRLVATQDFVFPDYVSGANQSEKIANYSISLKENFEGAFRNLSFKQQILSDSTENFVELKQGITAFSNNNPEFDILKTPSNQLSDNFDFTGVDNKDAFIANVATVQRLGVVSLSYPAIAALNNNGITSSMAVVQLSQEEFVDSYETVLGGSATAAIAYNNATYAVMAATAAATGVYQTINLNIPSIWGATPPPQPEWRSLFGNVDFCSCDHCLSVFSPSAYLVDSLELLRKNNLPAYNWLRAKRPDLWNVKLTCKNTNTVLPYIDLVNEILEDMMVASDTDAADPPAPYLYNINAHNTTLDERTLDAIPEYIGVVPSVYQTLMGALYPWKAPYNYFYEQSREFLGLIDVRPYQIPVTFSPTANGFTIGDIDLACSYLNITKINPATFQGEYSIITDNSATRLRNYYGVTSTDIIDPSNRDAAPIPVPAGNLVPAVDPFLNRVDIFMQQSGLNFTDVLELLDCYYINPIIGTTPVTRHLKITANPETACDTKLMKISGLLESDLLAIHRFVRLQRKTGWSKYELDAALTMQGVTAGAVFTDGIIIAIAQLKRLTEIFNCSLQEILPFWGDIGYMAYSKYGGDAPQLLITQYQNFFRNQAVVPNYDTIVGYPFPADMAAWKASSAGVTTAITQAQLDYVLAAFQISETDFDTLFNYYKANANLNTVFVTDANGSFSFNYLNVLSLYREFTLARFLKANVDEWCLLRNWMKGLAIDPFVNHVTSHLSSQLLFVEKVSRLRRSGLKVKELNYIFYDKFISDSDKGEKKAKLLTSYKGLRASLVKLNESVIDGSGNVDVKALLKKIGYALDTDDTDFMVNYVANLSEQSGSTIFDFTPADRTRLISLLPAELTATQKSDFALQLVGLPPSTDYTVIAKNDRLKLVNNIYTLSAMKGQTRSYMSTSFSVDLSVSEILLSTWIIVGGNVHAYDVLLNESFLNSTGDAILTEIYAQQVLLVIERFGKAAILINQNSLSSDEVAFLETNTSLMGIPDMANLPSGNAWGISPASSPITETVWVKLIDWLEVRQQLSPSPTGLFTILQNVFSLAGTPQDTPQGRKQTWFESFVMAMQVTEADLTVLVGAKTIPTANGTLNFDFNGDTPYLSPENYRRLFLCFDLQAELEVNMNSCVNIRNSILHAANQPDADFVVQSVKSRYSNDEWLDQAKSINDRLRIGRRDAMVDHLLAYPPLAYRKYWVTSNDIFETLLIDTQMMPIVKTSRIKLAISSVQLFIDRCVLQQESDLNGVIKTLTVNTITQWNLWRKWYRIWEANRKVFVYPENWIEPDLRDDKSPFFKEVEKFIKQNEINSETMADAYNNYLEQLTEVSHLDIIGYYTEPISNGTLIVDTIVHVWGRTKANPGIYYYRKRVTGVWSAWTKMDTQVDGKHFTAVKWRGRLRLYWLNFTEQIREKVSRIKVDEEAEPPEKYLKIELSWTELKNDRWQPKQVGKEWLQTDPYGAYRAIDTLYNYQHTFSWTPGMRPYTLKTFQDSFDYLKESMVPYCRINADGDLEIIVHGRKKYISQSNLNASLSGTITVDQINYFVESYYYSSFKYEEYKGRFTIKHNRVIADRTNVPHTFFDTLVEDYTYRPEESHYRYDNVKTNGYKHLINAAIVGNTVKLLSLAPVFDNAPTKEKYLVFSRTVPSGNNGNYIPFPKFFYKDYRNTFFVEKITTGAAIALAGGFEASFAAVESGGSTPLPSGQGAATWLAGLTFEVAEGTSNPGTQQPHSNYTVNGGTAVPYTGLDSFDYYRFYPFYHYRVNDLMDQLDRKGLDGLFDWDFVLEGQEDDLAFSSLYLPTSSVMHYYPVTAVDADHDVYPKTKLDFSNNSPTAIYNWELFFHIPLLIANKLMQDQKFDEALKWFKYVFNPGNVSGTSHGDGPERFWQFYPFYKESQQGIPSLDQIMSSPNLLSAVQLWANNPFNPHLVARTRISAYMKNVLMKYLDNLIAWGDQLFRRDTIESINEASLLYINAAEILGKQPVKIPSRLTSAPKSYAELTSDPANMNAFSNALVSVETILAPTLVSQQPGTGAGGSTGALTIFYFCMPPNDKLLSYWDIVADRLFKIRNSQNIDGVERQLALFEPPIDPALLVRAAAAGLSLSDAVNQLSAPMPQYRFVIMQQKATEMVQDVKSLGAALLSAVEKKDAEHLSLLRSSQEINVMEGMREIRQYQLQEAQTQLAALNDQKDMVTIRRNYYSGLIEKGLNPNEQMQLDSIQASIPLKIAEGSLQTLASVFYAIPDFKIASPFSLGATFGGSNVGPLTNAIASALGVVSTVNDIQGSMAGIKGGYARRFEDWNLQLKLANGELKQIEKQLIGAEIRQSIAQKELEVQQLQFDNSLDLDAAMRDKYSNEDLYDWMISQISLTYFQSYKLAFDLAKRAERCYAYELGITAATPFIQFGYWDSLKKGLLAGEALGLDIKRMDNSYMDLNKRQHEMTKHISLASLDANALIQLKAGNTVTINIPEWLFDMDYPGHYFRRIKSVSISIPCVAGPYSTVSAKLTLNSSKYRKNAISGSTPYPETPVGNDSRFAYMLGGGQSIATSAAQNDSGMFEMNFRDERYLPFEGAGVISQWKLELPSKYASFDVNTISDVIIHIQYTAKFDGGLTQAANNNLATLLADADPITGAKLPRLFSLRHEFSNAWYAYGNAFTDNPLARILMRINTSNFPLYCKNKKITLDSFVAQLNPKNTLTGSYKLKITYFSDGYRTLPITLNATNKYGGNVTIAENDPPFIINGNTKIIQLSLEKEDGSTVNMDQLLEDIYLVATYHLNNLDSTIPADDQPQPDIPLSTMVSWWKADSSENDISAGRITNLKDLSGNGIDLMPYIAGSGPELLTEGGIQYLNFQNSPLYDNTQVSAIRGGDSFTFIYIGNSGWGNGIGDEWNIQVNDTAFSVCLTWGGWVFYPIGNNDETQNLFFGALLQSPNYGSSTMNIYDNSGDVNNTTNVANGYLRNPGQIGFLMGAGGLSMSNYVNGKTYELLVYKRVLSLDERKSLLAYLKSKYPFIR